MVSLMALQTMAPCLVARKVNFSNAGYHKREGFVASDAFCREVIRVPICNRLALRSPDFQFFIKTGFSPQHKIPARYRRRTDRGCHSTGLLMCRALGNITLVTDWRPAVEQLMLITSIALAYIAGIATPGRPALVVGPFGNLPVRTDRSSDEDATLPPKPQPLEKQAQSQRCEEPYEGDRWSVTQSKIAAALSKLAKDEGDVETYEINEGAVRNPVLSLQAISAIPRLRLLVRSLEHLRNEVDSISDSSKLLSPIEWSKLSRDLLCQSIEPICRSWLALEPCLANREDVTEASSVIKNEPEDVSQSVKLRRSIRQGRDLALNYLQRSGKAELYMDVIFFLRFKTTRPGSCWGQNLMSKHASNVLEDLVVASANAASAIYLGRSSVMGGREENDWPILVRSSIKSTRALERFRNEVALRSWLQQNFSSVVAMFEDRFELWTIQRLCSGGQVSEEEIKKSTEQGPQARKDEDPAQGIKLAVVQLSARRSKELRALTGWRYFYSLYLEFSDIVGPLLKVLISKFGDAVSFLLVRLIGRALGLIYQGVRQSVRWSPK